MKQFNEQLITISSSRTPEGIITFNIHVDNTKNEDLTCTFHLILSSWKHTHNNQLTPQTNNMLEIYTIQITRSRNREN